MCQHAPHIYFNFRQNIDSNLISQQVRIPYSTPGTFYSVLNWNNGEEFSSGYAGFQQLHDGQKTVHFSLWCLEFDDPQFRPIYSIENSQFDNFTNERKGRKFSAPFNFDDNVWYKFDVEVSHPDDNNTLFDLHISNVDTAERILIVRMNYPIPNCLFRHSYGAFLEDFLYTNQRTREMHLRQGFVRENISQNQIQWETQELSYDINGDHNLNGGTIADYLFLKSGGNTELTTGNHTFFNDPSYR